MSNTDVSKIEHIIGLTQRNKGVSGLWCDHADRWELVNEIVTQRELVAKWRDEATALLARTMVAELAAARVKLAE